jgi:hypothetical protein
MTDTVSTYKKDSTVAVATEAKIIIARIFKHIEEDNCRCCRNAVESTEIPK